MFSKADAEAAGWVFVHAQSEQITDLGDRIFRRKPGFYRAEKYVNSKLVNQAGETEDALLAAIEDYEEHLRSRDPESAGAVTVAEGLDY
jgi:hypothetical protein